VYPHFNAKCRLFLAEFERFSLRVASYLSEPV